MPPTPMLSKMQLVFAILDDVLERRLMRTLTPADSKLLIEFLSKIIITKRMYLLRTPQDAIDLWDLIGPHEALVDFVLNLAVELTLWFDMSEVNTGQLVSDLSNSFGQHHMTGKDRAIPADTLERLPTAQAFGDLCKNNRWIIGLLLISLRGMSVLAKIPVPVGPPTAKPEAAR